MKFFAASRLIANTLTITMIMTTRLSVMKIGKALRATSLTILSAAVTATSKTSSTNSHAGSALSATASKCTNRPVSLTVLTQIVGRSRTNETRSSAGN